jgi:mRNA interferase MazF
MRVRRGDVVMVDWIFSDRTGSKIRPAVVVQADFLNGLIADTVLIAITRTTRGAASTEVAIDPALDARAGLRHISIASCNNFITLDQALIRRTIGTLSPVTMQRIETALRTALGLP